MKIGKLIKKIKDNTNNQVDINVIKCNSGHWLNHINGQWISDRIYISQKSDSDLPNKILNKVVDRFNKKSLKYNIEIIVK